MPPHSGTSGHGEETGNSEREGRNGNSENLGRDLGGDLGCWICLQGLGTPFFAVLGAKIIAAGGTVIRVNFCGGDAAFSGPETQVDFRGRPADMPGFYADLFDAHHPRGIILFGDQRPVHRPAIAAARARGIAVLCIEEGYERPGWLTVESGGTNGASHGPKTADSVRRLAAAVAPCPALTHPLATNFGARVRWDLWHKAANIALGRRYRHYRTHRPYPMQREAAGWIRRLSRRLAMRRHTHQRWAVYAATQPRFFLFPLQLNSDTQIRVHADVGGMDGYLDTVLTSFAAHAPQDTRLLIKNHPLDNGVIDYQRMIARRTADLGTTDRVDFIDGGDLGAMLDMTAGVVLVNSTTGLAALQRGVPVHASGTAIYRMDGLTSGQSLADFWIHPQAPDATLCRQFMTLLRRCAMVEGDLFSAAGIDRGTDEIIQILQGAYPRFRTDSNGVSDIGPIIPRAAKDPS